MTFSESGFPKSGVLHFAKKKPLLFRRLDYIFITNVLQQQVSKIDILPSILSDHSPVVFSLVNDINEKRGRGYWKFNNLLLHENDFVTGVKSIISKSSNSSEFDSAQIKWETLKFRLATYSIIQNVEFKS